MNHWQLHSAIMDRTQKLRFESNYPLQEREQALNQIEQLSIELATRAASPGLFEPAQGELNS
jgi:hypothetical protein